MDGQFGFSSTSNNSSLAQMFQSRDKEIKEIAKIEHLIRQGQQFRPSMYKRAMASLGDLLVASGMRLKAHYSVQQAFRTH